MRLVSIETRQILEHWRWLVEKLVVELLKCRKMRGADLKSFIEKCSEEGSAEEHGKGSR